VDYLLASDGLIASDHAPITYDLRGGLAGSEG
jgi:hypothetical protein